MIIFCYLQIKPLKKINYQFTETQQLVTLFPNLLIIEADNHSEAFTIQQSAELMNRADQIVVYLEVEKDENIGSLSRIFEVLRRHKNLEILTFGKNSMLNKYAKMFPKDFKEIKNSDESIRAITQLLKA